MFQLLNTPNYMQWRIKVHFSKYTGEWQVEGRSLDKGNVKASNIYGTGQPVHIGLLKIL